MYAIEILLDFYVAKSNYEKNGDGNTIKQNKQMEKTKICVIFIGIRGQVTKRLFWESGRTIHSISRLNIWSIFSYSYLKERK